MNNRQMGAGETRPTSRARRPPPSAGCSARSGLGEKSRRGRRGHQAHRPAGRCGGTKSTATAPTTGRRGHQEEHGMAVVTMRQLLESGVHFGHQTRRWNPKMKRFIFTERNGIYIIDLQQSLSFIDRAYDFIKETVA